MRDVESSRSRYILVEEYQIGQVRGYEENYVLPLVGDTVYPDLVKTPKVTDDWVNSTPNYNKCDTRFIEVENPGIRSAFFNNYPGFS